MKLPFDFGFKLIFRLLLPGLILTVGLFPVLKMILVWGGWADKIEYVFPIVAFVIGWLFLISDMHIYMLFEGRRYWPEFLLKHFYAREAKRLNSIQKNIDDYLQLKKNSTTTPPPDVYQRYVENYVDRRNFMNNNGEYEVKRPTRLGNLIKAYEEYPYRVYRMDAVFYWPRLWLKLTKETREELDNQQAVADSTVYTAFALFCTGLLWLIYAVLSSLQTLFINHTDIRLPPSKVTVFEYLPHWLFSWLLVVAFIALGYCVYRVCVHTHASYGDLFKALFDIYQKEVDVSPILEQVVELRGDSSILSLGRKEQLEITRNYLEYALVKCARCNEYISLGKFKNHQCP